MISSRDKRRLLQADYVQNSYSQILSVIASNKFRALKKGIKSNTQVTSIVMRKYLDWLLIMINIQNRMQLNNVVLPEELQKHIFSFFRLQLLTFNMFMEFFNYQLMNGTDQNIHSILREYKKYFLQGAPKCVRLNQYFKEQIFYKGPGRLVQSLDSTFNYSQDDRYVNEYNLYKNTTIQKDSDKLNFFFAHLNNNKQGAENISQAYDVILDDLEKNLALIAADARTSNDQFVQPMNKLLSTAQAIILEDIPSTSKLFQIAALMVGLYNEIQNKINSYFFVPAPPKIAQAILAMLNQLGMKAPGFMQIKQSGCNNQSHSTSISMQVSDLFYIGDNIATRFNQGVETTNKLRHEPF